MLMRQMPSSIVHNKTGESVNVPLYDQVGFKLWPDLVPGSIMSLASELCW
jgi:hypothetical protein